MKRTCQMIIALCLPLLLCGPVRAQHSGPYVGAFIGGNALMTAEGSDDLGNFGLKFEPALLGSGVLGWDFEPGNPAGEGRVELEYTRRSNPLDQVKFVQGSFKGGGGVTADSLKGAPSYSRSSDWEWSRENDRRVYQYYKAEPFWG